MKLELKNTSGYPDEQIRAVFRAALSAVVESFPGLSFMGDRQSRRPTTRHLTREGAVYSLTVRGTDRRHAVCGRATLYGRWMTTTIPRSAWRSGRPARTLYALFLHELWHSAGVRHPDFPDALMHFDHHTHPEALDSSMFDPADSLVLELPPKAAKGLRVRSLENEARDAAKLGTMMLKLEDLTRKAETLTKQITKLRKRIARRAGRTFVA